MNFEMDELGEIRLDGTELDAECVAERLFAAARRRTEWMKQFETHADYVAELDKFVRLSEVDVRFAALNNWYEADNTSVRVENGLIVAAIKH